MIVIEKEKCIGCGLCVKDCPAGKLKLEEQKAVYTPGCIECGHCVAVCPRAAASIPEYDMADVEEYNKDKFKLLKYAIPDWFNWDNWEWKEEKEIGK